MTPLNDSNFLLYSAANYNSVVYDQDEFFEDLKKFKYLKRLFSRYEERNELKERLILNHLITLYNVFEHSATTRMLFLRIPKKHWPFLKTFLIFMERMPQRIEGVGNFDVINTSDISVDHHIASALRNLQ